MDSVNSKHTWKAPSSPLLGIADEFGFVREYNSLSSNYIQEYSGDYTNKGLRRLSRWPSFDRMDNLFSPKNNKMLKSLVRRGIPNATLRREVWLRCLRIPEFITVMKGEYTRLLTVALPDPVSAQIILDVPRTFPTHHLFHFSEGKESLRKVLHAFAARFPTVGYCQSLNFITGTLFIALCNSKISSSPLHSFFNEQPDLRSANKLITFEDEEIVFLCLCQLVCCPQRSNLTSMSPPYPSLNGPSPPPAACVPILGDARERVGLGSWGLYVSGMDKLHEDADVLWRLLENYMGLGWVGVLRRGGVEGLLVSSWLLGGLSTILPATVVVRVWDTVMVEGRKPLLRVCVVLLMLHVVIAKESCLIPLAVWKERFIRQRELRSQFLKKKQNLQGSVNTSNFNNELLSIISNTASRVGDNGENTNEQEWQRLLATDSLFHVFTVLAMETSNGSDKEEIFSLLNSIFRIIKKHFSKNVPREIAETDMWIQDKQTGKISRNRGDNPLSSNFVSQIFDETMLMSLHHLERMLPDHAGLMKSAFTLLKNFQLSQVRKLDEEAEVRRKQQLSNAKLFGMDN